MTRDQVKLFAKVIRIYVAKQIAKLPVDVHQAAIRSLEARIKALEERPPVAYGGVWRDGQDSKKGVFVTYSGSLWYCARDTRDKPGTSDAFILAVKRGQDGKDLRSA